MNLTTQKQEKKMKNFIKLVIFGTIVSLMIITTIKIDLLLFSGNLSLLQRIFEDLFFIIALLIILFLLKKIFSPEYISSIRFVAFASAVILYVIIMFATIETALSLIKDDPLPNVEKIRIEIIKIPSLRESNSIKMHEVDSLKPLNEVSNHKFERAVATTQNKDLYYCFYFSENLCYFTVKLICCTFDTSPDFSTELEISPQFINTEFGTYVFTHDDGKNIKIDSNKGEILLTYNFRRNFGIKNVQRIIIGGLTFIICSSIFALIMIFIEKNYSPNKAKESLEEE